MKVIKYQYLSAVINGGEKNVFIGKTVPHSEANEEIAKQEAYGGEYTIEDDGVEDKPTPEQRIAELEEALALLLSGVTE